MPFHFLCLAQSPGLWNNIRHTDKEFYYRGLSSFVPTAFVGGHKTKVHSVLFNRIGNPLHAFSNFSLVRTSNCGNTSLLVNTKAPFPATRYKVWIMLQLVQLLDVIRRYKVVVIHSAVVIVRCRPPLFGSRYSSSSSNTLCRLPCPEKILVNPVAFAQRVCGQNNVIAEGRMTETSQNLLESRILDFGTLSIQTILTPFRDFSFAGLSMPLKMMRLPFLKRTCIGDVVNVI